MRTIDEFRKTHPIQTAPDRLPNLRMVAQEAVRAEAITGDPIWDHFLAFLEAAAKSATRYRDQELQRLRDPMIVSDDEIRKLRAVIAGLDARIATLEEVIAFPKLLKTKGEEANSLIEKLTQS